MKTQISLRSLIRVFVSARIKPEIKSAASQGAHVRRYVFWRWRLYNVASTSMQRHDVASTLRRRYINVSLYNVASTSIQRHDVASTLRRRCINVMCPLGIFSPQSKLNSSNTSGSFTLTNSYSFLSPFEILPIAQENKKLRKFSYFIMKVYAIEAILTGTLIKP